MVRRPASSVVSRETPKEKTDLASAIRGWVRNVAPKAHELAWPSMTQRSQAGSLGSQRLELEALGL